MSKQTTQISVDSGNRLVITDIFGDTSREVVIDRVGGKKRLRKVVLDGNWSLTEDHDLKLNVLGSNSSIYGKTLIFQGSVERTGGARLAFRFRRCDAISGLRTGTIELKGRWLADGNNRITFNAAKSSGRYDVLRFQGAWQVNKRNELTYKYSRTVMKTKTARDAALAFNGYWELGKNNIIYRLERSNDSFFRFKALLQSRSLRASDGKIKYQVGIKYSRGRVYKRIERSVALYGTWKLGKDLGVSFEIASPGRKHQKTQFTVEKLITKHGTIIVSLKTRRGEKLGLDVDFSTALGDDAKLFLSLGHSASESRMVGGIKVKF